MASAYPSALDTATTFPTTIQDDTDSTSGSDLGLSTTTGFLATLLNNAGDALVKIETELGATPKGTFSNVATRLSARSTVRKTADQTNATTTYANVTDLTFAVAIGQDYWFEFYVPWSSSAAGVASRWSVTFPAVTGYGVFWSENVGAGTGAVPTTGGAAVVWDNTGNSSGAATLDVGSATSPAANVITVARITGVLSNPSAVGSIQLQVKAEVAGTITVKRGAYGELYLN